jgi:hypothetical protein
MSWLLYFVQLLNRLLLICGMASLSVVLTVFVEIKAFEWSTTLMLIASTLGIIAGLAGFLDSGSKYYRSYLEVLPYIISIECILKLSATAVFVLYSNYEHIVAPYGTETFTKISICISCVISILAVILSILYSNTMNFVPQLTQSLHEAKDIYT